MGGAKAETDKAGHQKKPVCLMLGLSHGIADARIVRMARSLASQYEVHVVAGGRPDRCPRTNLDLTFHTVSSRSEAFRKALGLSRRLKPSFLHCHDLWSLAIGFMAKALYRQTKLIFDVHEFYEKQRNKLTSLGGLFDQACVHLAIPVFGRQIDGFIYAVPKQDRFYGRFKKPGQLIYNFPEVDSPLYSGGSGQKQFLLIYEGGISPRRGLLQYLALTRKLKQDGLKDARLVLVGDFSDAGSMIEAQRYIQENALTDSVVIAGKVEESEVPRFVKSSRIGLCLIADSYYNTPSISLPTKVLEYMVCGIPVIYSDNLSLLSELTHGEGGVAVKYGDIEAAAAAVKKILDNYESFAGECRKVLRLINWAAEAEKLLGFYRKLGASVVPSK